MVGAMVSFRCVRDASGSAERAEPTCQLSVKHNLDAACQRTTGDSRKVICQNRCLRGPILSNSRTRPKTSLKLASPAMQKRSGAFKRVIHVTRVPPNLKFAPENFH